MKTFHLNIVTPVKQIFDGAITFVSVPGKEGSLGILAGHSPIVALLKSGELLVRQDKQDTRFTISSGILEVNADHQVLVLAESAEEIKK